MTRHPVDVLAAYAGVTFGALAVGFLLDGLDVWDLDTRWFAPGLLIVLGLASVVATIVRREPEGASPTPPVPPEDPEIVR